MENNLPNSWVECTLGDVCTKPQYGWTSKASKDGKIKYLRTTDISNSKLNWETVPYCLDEPDDVNKYQVHHNDILVSRAGSVGFNFRIAKDVNFKAVFASYLIRFKTFDEITSKYISYFLKSESYWKQISDFTAGIAIPNVNASKLEELRLPLAPLAEQQRIVAKLDELMEKIDRSRARLERIPKILKRFRQSVLAAAVSGKLTEQWRSENPNKSGATNLRKSYEERVEIYNQELKLAKKKSFRKPSKPVEFTINDQDYLDFPASWVVTIPELIASPERYSLAIGPFGSNLKVTDYKTSGVPLVFVRHIKSNDFKGQNLKFVSKKKASELIAHSISPLDLVITKMGEPPGDCEIYPSGSPEAIITADCLKFRVWDKYFNRVYFKHLINSDFVKEQLGVITQGVAQQKISLERFKTLQLPVPCLEEQNEIVKIVDRLFALAKGIEMRYLNAKTLIDKLPQSLLAKAFAGDLIPQDPNDEPAEILLNRLLDHKKSEEATIKKRKLREPKKIESSGTDIAYREVQERAVLDSESSVTARIAEIKKSGLYRLVSTKPVGKHFTFKDIQKLAKTNYDETWHEIYEILNLTNLGLKPGLEQVYSKDKNEIGFKLTKLN